LSGVRRCLICPKSAEGEYEHSCQWPSLLHNVCSCEYLSKSYSIYVTFFQMSYILCRWEDGNVGWGVLGAFGSAGKGE
jgi:hypothetical protein